MTHFDSRLPRFTNKSITDPDKWRRLITKIRAQGYAFSDDEAVVGGRAVGLPICNSAGKLIAGLSIAMPKALLPLSRLPRLVAKGKQATKSLSGLLAKEF